jgi:large subunit ribosomal protein L31
MKKEIHPTYYPDASVHCACGNKWKTGSTKEKLDISICSECHPFYTGTEKILDTRGRVEKFRKRLEKTAQKATTVTQKAPRKNKK